MPMILLDGVDFFMDEGEDTTDEKHIMFWLFISDLYQSAHAGGVVVFLGISNKLLAKQLAILNGNTKIVPSTASIAPSRSANADVQDCFLQESELPSGQPFEVFWCNYLGWGKENIVKFLKLHFKMLTKSKLEDTAERYGNIRSAIAEAEAEFPALAESTTSESLVESSLF
jgi:hypothetical protein